jgi:hypothetical protein
MSDTESSEECKSPKINSYMDTSTIPQDKEEEKPEEKNGGQINSMHDNKKPKDHPQFKSPLDKNLFNKNMMNI